MQKYQYRVVHVPIGFKRPYREWIQQRLNIWPTWWPFFWRNHRRYATGYNESMAVKYAERDRKRLPLDTPDSSAGM